MTRATRTTRTTDITPEAAYASFTRLIRRMRRERWFDLDPEAVVRASHCPPEYAWQDVMTWDGLAEWTRQVAETVRRRAGAS